MSIESIKEASNGLRGTLLAELAAETDHFGDDNAHLLKFHGIYQQDERDLRKGQDREYVFMVRAAVPGGALAAEQYLVGDDLADWIGDGTLRITSRQGLQWHHIRKGSLRSLVWILNQSLVTTLGACGDVVRNTVACPAPSPERTALGHTDLAEQIATRFRPRTKGYWEIWIDGERAVSAAEPETDPVYGTAYLPRKFKIGIAHPGDNCVDVYTHDVGVVPLSGEGDTRRATVLVGGGQGRSHNIPSTYPRLADPLTTVPVDQVADVVEAVVVVQRDHGNRSDRKQARLKYLVDSWGLDRFRGAVADALGHDLPDPEPLRWARHADHLGWHAEGPDRWYLGVAVPTGRIADTKTHRLRSALRTILERHRLDIRLTPQQNILLTGIETGLRPEIDAVLADHGVAHAVDLAPVVRNAMACVALPTCALALTDAERAFPVIVSSLEELLPEVGLSGLDLDVRIVGCPNGCARPYSTEVGFVGRRRGVYDIHLGGAADGTRLNRLYAELVPIAEIAATLRPVLAAYAEERRPGERFGEWCNREDVARLSERFRAAGVTA